MINTQLLRYPNTTLKPDPYIAFKDVITPNVIPGVNKIKLIWGSLLGKDNTELMMIALHNSPKFITFIEKTREDFKANKTNLRKFPMMSESDWE